MKIKDEKTGKTKDVRLPKDFKNKWVKLLRSGKYKQGESALCNEVFDGDDRLIGHNYCCLGIACIAAGIKPNFNGFISDIKGISKIPKILRQDEDIPIKLSAMNDSGNWSFKRIASWINKNL